VMEFVNIYHV